MSKKFVFALSAFALLGLSACADDTVEEGDTTIVEDDSFGSDPAMNAAPPPMDDDGDSFSVDEDGMNADINDGDTSINANLDDDPSLDVEVD